jgi:hypothetical protein
MLVWIVVTLVCTIGGGVVGFLAGYVYSETKREREQSEEKIRTLEIRLIASKVCMEWQAERERKEENP